MKKLAFIFILLWPFSLQAADTKTTGLTELTAVASGDILYIVDDPGGTPLSKKITILNLFDIIDTYAELNTIVTDQTLTHNALFDTFSELNTIVADKTLVNEEDAVTWDALGTFGLGITITTGDPFTLGTTRWDNGSDLIDGEQIAPDTIDDDSIDFSDVTGADLTLTDCGAITSTDVVTSIGYISTSATTNPLVDLNPAHIGTANIIDITPSAVISTATSIWNAININGTALDPSGDDILLCGMNVDMSGVVFGGAGGDIDGIGINMASGEDHAIHVSQGKIILENTLAATAGAEFTLLDIQFHTGSMNANSSVHAMDVATPETPAGTVVAVGTHSNVEVIQQSIGTFSTPSQTEYAGEKHTGGTVWADGVDTSEIFVVDDDEVYVGSVAQFGEIDVIMTTPSSKTVTPTFHYNTAADAWTEFFPADDTDGFQQSGIIRWTLADISGSWTNDGDPGGADSSTGYWIKIIRTANADPGTPTPTTVKTGAITSYSWSKTGAVDVLSMEADTITEGGVAVINATQGGSWTGAHTFGGATTTIPWKVNTTAAPTAEGQVIWESDTDELTVGDGSVSVVIAAKTNTVFCFNIHDIDTGMDDIKMPFTRAVTITKVTAFVTAGTNVVGRLYEVDGDGDDADAVGVESSDWTFTVGETEDSSFNNATFDAGDYIQWDTTSVSGSVTGFMISVEGYEI